jgi:peptidoglycan/LPS O-acetylase OafA/YrhL
MKRIPELDGILGVAIAMVLVFHFFVHNRCSSWRDPLWRT